MSRSTLKLALQIIGVLIGLSGTTALFTGVAVLALAGKKGYAGVTILLSAVAITIGSYCLWIAYISVRRFGPRAVLHITGAVAVCLLSIPKSILPNPTGHFWLNLFYIVWFLVIALGYRKFSQRLNRILFAPEHPCIPPSAPMPPARAPIPE